MLCILWGYSQASSSSSPSAHNTAHILEAADGSDDGHDDNTIGMPELIDSDDEVQNEADEDEQAEPEDTELGKWSVISVKTFQLIIDSAPYEMMEHTHLCFL